MEILNIAGAKVFVQALEQPVFRKETYSFDLEPGMYIFNLSDGATSISRKIVVSNK